MPNQFDRGEESRKRTARKIGEDSAEIMETTEQISEAEAKDSIQPPAEPQEEVLPDAEPFAVESEIPDKQPEESRMQRRETFGNNKMQGDLADEKKAWSTKKKVILGVVIAVAAVAAVVLAWTFLGQNKVLAGEDVSQIVDNGTFYEGVTMVGVDLSGKTADQVREELETKIKAELKNISIDYKVNDASYTLTGTDLGAAVDVEEAITAAMMYGREGTFVQRQQAISEAKTNGVEIELPVTYDEAAILAAIQANDANINIPAQDAKVVMTKLRDEDKLYSDVEISYQEAVTGLAVDDEELAAAIYAQLEQNNFEPVTANAQVTQPNLTVEQIQEEYAVIGDFETEYASSAYGRRYNIWKMADIINGLEILPGETWSINEEAGPRTYSRGWKGAPGISDGEYKEEAGGGICQTSSTLYGAVLRAEVEVVDRSHHSWPLDYVPGGLDATISTGSPDFKIRNNYDVPIYIIAKCDGQDSRTIRIQIYGPKFEDGLRREFTSELIGTFGGGKVEYIDDPTLPAGTEQVIIQEHIGKKYQTYKHYYDADGNLVKTEKFSVETYDNKPAKIRRGTAAVTPTPTPTPEQPATPTTEPTPTPEVPAPEVPAPETTPSAEPTA